MAANGITLESIGKQFAFGKPYYVEYQSNNETEPHAILFICENKDVLIKQISELVDELDSSKKGSFYGSKITRNSNDYVLLSFDNIGTISDSYCFKIFGFSESEMDIIIEKFEKLYEKENLAEPGKKYHLIF